MGGDEFTILLADVADASAISSVAAKVLETIAQVNGDWAAWQKVKTGDLLQLNNALTSAGIQPITVPPENELNLGEASGGVDLP